MDVLFLFRTFDTQRYVYCIVLAQHFASSDMCILLVTNRFSYNVRNKLEFQEK